MPGTIDFVVDTTSGDFSNDPHVAALPNGGFVVTWTDYVSVYVRLYDPSGAPAGQERVIATVAGNPNAEIPDSQITVLANGDLVVTWSTEVNTEDSSENAVHSQLLLSTGTAFGGVVTVSDASEPRISALAGGGYVLSWSTDAGNVAARAYDANGVSLGAVGVVGGNYAGAGQIASADYSAVAGLAGGGFVLQWSVEVLNEETLETISETFYVQPFSASGAAAAPPVSLGPRSSAVGIAGLENGGFVVTWVAGGVRAQIFVPQTDQSGNTTFVAAGPAFAVNTTSAWEYSDPTVAGTSDGGFVVTWGNEYSPDVEEIMGQRFTASGQPDGAEFVIASGVIADDAAVAALPGNGFVAVWDEENSESIQGSMFAGDHMCVLDLDGDGVASAVEIDQSALFDRLSELARQEEALTDQVITVQAYIRNLQNEQTLVTQENVLQILSGLGDIAAEFVPGAAGAGLALADTIAKIFNTIQDPSTEADASVSLLFNLVDAVSELLRSPSDLLKGISLGHELAQVWEDLEESFERLGEIDALLTAYAEKLQIARTELELVEAAMHELYECLDLEPVLAASSSSSADGPGSQGAGAAIVPITSELLPDGVFVAAGTLGGDLIDARAEVLAGASPVVLIDPEAGDDTITVSSGNVYISDPAGNDRIVVLTATGEAVSVADITQIEIVDGNLVLSVGDLFLAAEGVEQVTFAEGSYSIVDNALRFTENPPVRARLIFTEAGQDFTIGGDIAVTGTVAPGEVIEVLHGNVTLDASFNVGGDTVVLPGNAGSYTAVLTGSFVTIAGGEASVAIPVGIAGLSVQFADSTRVLRFDTGAGQVVLGEQAVTGTLAAVAASGPALVDPAETGPDSLGRLILTQGGQDVDIGGNVAIVGTTSPGEVITILEGTVRLDASFNSGGDTVVLPGNAGSYTASLSGSFVTISGGDISVAIPVGIAGLTVAFDDVSPILRFDTGTGQVMLGGLVVSSSGSSSGTIAVGARLAEPGIALDDLFSSEPELAAPHFAAKADPMVEPQRLEFTDSFAFA